MSHPDFSIEVFQNEYLPDRGREVNAIVTVTSSGVTDAAPQDAASGAEIIIIDCSGSMGSPRRKIAAARQATTVALDVIRDGVAAADFAAMMQTAMGKEVADVALRVWTPQHARIRFVKQVTPTIEDVTARRAEAGPQAGDYPTGAWGAESRDYHLCVEVEPAGVGQEMLAARVSLVVASPPGSQVLGQGLVKAIWTEDEALSTRINGHVAHYTGQAISPRPSTTGWRPARPATRRPRPRSWAARSAWRTSPGTRTRPGCSPGWSTWWTRRRAPYGSGPGSPTRTR